jgi:DNA mismatch endonuclease (patch repair protein)
MATAKVHCRSLSWGVFCHHATSIQGPAARRNASGVHWTGLHSPVRPRPVSKERSELMGRVRQRGTAPELLIRRLARAAGLELKANLRGLPGSPDLASIESRAVIFVHGCFWHRHVGCRAASTPRHNRAFWVEKFEANCRRDRRKTRLLRRLGYRVMTVWECDVKSEQRLRRMERRLVRFITRPRSR